jgi:hypothetical protein
MSLVTFALRGRNPDVLTCIAYLSNDEAFTPPDFVNQLLDRLETAWAEANGGASIWADPEITRTARYEPRDHPLRGGEYPSASDADQGRRVRAGDPRHDERSRCDRFL